MFYLCAGIDVFGIIIFLIFGSGEIQKWAYITERESLAQQQYIPQVASTRTLSDMDIETLSPSSVKSCVNPVAVNTKSIHTDLPVTKDINIKLKYGVVNLAFEIEPVEETAV